MRGDRFCLVIGDFNDNYLNEPKSPFVKHMLQQNFSQLVRSPTHAEGGLLDHVYVRNATWNLEVDVNFRHYSDHAAISVIQSCPCQ